MRGQIETLLERGIEAAQAGENKRAQDIFIHVIELDQNNELAWLCLSAVVENRADKLVCLENVLFINPNNTHAATDLRHLLRHPIHPSAPPSMLPRLATSETVDEEALDEEVWEGAWEWAGKEREEKEEERKEEEERERRPSVPDVSPIQTGRVCPRCGFRNPGWVYTCDRCGASLQSVDLREALGPASKPRGRSFITLIEAWSGAFTFNRLFAFLPEIELASWRRSLAALAIAALLSSAWHAIIAVVLWPLASEDVSGGPNVTVALSLAVGVLLLALLRTLIWVPIAPLTWVGARLVGGRRGLKTHAHLAAVAISAWVMLTALLAPLSTLVSYLVGDEGLPDPFLGGMQVFVGVATGIMAFTWLAQAIRTAHRLSATRATLAMLLAIALGAALLFGLNLLNNEWFTDLGSVLEVLFLPCLG